MHAVKLEYTTNQYFKFQERVVFDTVIVLFEAESIIDLLSRFLLPVERNFESVALT
jgi:hypothetical protein